MTRLFLYFSELSRKKKRSIILGADIFLVLSSLWLAFSLRSGELYSPLESEIWVWLMAPVVAIPVFYKFGLYRAIIRYIGFQALWAIFQAVSLYILLWGAGVFLLGVSGFPRSVILINWVVCLVLVGGSRMLGRWGLSKILPGVVGQSGTAKRALIYGAGSAGIQLSIALAYGSEFKPVAFVDDNKSIQNHMANGIRVYSPELIEELVTDLDIEEILLAIPSASPSRRKELLLRLEPLTVKVRTLPVVAEIAEGKVKKEDIRNVDIADLLGRDPVPPKAALLSANISGKVVMITGAGGSIGSELCKQVVDQSPGRIILYDQSEFNLYSIERDLVKKADNFVSILGSVTDQEQLEFVCSTHRVDTIYHAAAYKHVPIVEKNAVMGVTNNVLGTWRAAEAAINTGVKTFVLISSDKAVRPTNVMGASKRFAELILQGLSSEQPGGDGTRFTMVRFGNVLGSSGSVVPLFREQIRNRETVTVTHPEVTRYFMTLSEATQLVIQAGAMGTGGDVFVLDMGEPVNIMDLARQMIRLSGLEVRDAEHPDGDIDIRITGLRPGEKLYEELLVGAGAMQTDHPRIMRAKEAVLPMNIIKRLLLQLQDAIKRNDADLVRALLGQAIDGYRAVPAESKLVARGGGLDDIVVPIDAAKSRPE